VTPSLFDPGLEGVAVAETELSRVEADGDLLVRGFPIAELAANADYEETVFLLVHGRLPTETEHERFGTELAAQRELDETVREVLRQAASTERSPMTALRMGLAAADLDTDASEPLAVAKRVVAVVPTVVATFWRYRTGEEPLPPREDLSHAANYLYMLTGEEPSPARCDGLEAFLTTTAEHGLNTSTFAARVVTSTESDLVSAATAAVGALKGPLHGGQFTRVRELLWAAHEAPSAADYVRERLADDDRLPGFGHRVYEVRDPRAAVLAATADRFYEETGEDDFLDTVRTVESVGAEELADRQASHQPQPTVDFYAAALLHGLDVPGPLLPATFAVARVGGWVAHCLEQRENNHLVRPGGRYVGQTERTWTPIEDRREASGRPLSEHATVDSLEPVSETLAVLSEPTRLEILLGLFDGDTPLAYSALMDTTSIEDKGRFNYHLRQLRGYFVRDTADGYALTDAGRTVVHAIVTDDGLFESLSD
jgi:citrate synthase